MSARLAVEGTPVKLASPEVLATLGETEEQWSECNRHVWLETETGALWFVPTYKVQVRHG